MVLFCLSYLGWTTSNKPSAVQGLHSQDSCKLEVTQKKTLHDLTQFTWGGKTEESGETLPEEIGEAENTGMARWY